MRVPVAPALLLALLLAGCGAEPPTIDPSGVDGLTVPTPEPDPDDFVSRIDNPWLPYAHGSTWTYRSASADGAETVTVEVDDDPRTVAGVGTTVVSVVTRDAGGELLEQSERWFAQDRAGNVWQFGASTTTYVDGAASPGGSWEAGVDGAQAALAMPAEPRLGDGYRTAYAPGVVEGQAEVVDLEDSVSVPYADFDGVLETEDRDRREPGVVERRSYVQGVGLVRVVDVEGPELLVELLTYVYPK